MANRREFLAATGGISLGAALLPMPWLAAAEDTPKLKILFLGGTGLLGPATINRAVERGHTVTMFNRDAAAPKLFPNVEHLLGDRYTDLSLLKKAVEDGRQWDAVIDTFTYVPKTVTDAMDILLPAMKQFVVISTVSVYASDDTPGMTEDAELASIPPDVAAQIMSHEQVGEHFGAMKALVEKAAEQRFPGKVTTIRPGLIAGPRDLTGRFTYWAVRGSEGGRMIAPGDGKDFIQYIDVRDLGNFVVHCCEKQHFGVYNAVTPAGQTTTQKLIDSVVKLSNNVTEPIWIPADFLAQHQVQPWQELPAWVPNDPDRYHGYGQLSSERATKAGLETRSIDETNRVCLEYFTRRSAELQAERGEEFGKDWKKMVRGGLDPDKERMVLEAWDKKA